MRITTLILNISVILYRKYIDKFGWDSKNNFPGKYATNICLLRKELKIYYSKNNL